MKKQNKEVFWISYGDIMTSLFFIMLVLFGLYQLRVSASLNELKEIKQIQLALENLDSRYFKFDDKNKRYKLNTEVNFNSNSFDITDIPLEKRKLVLEAGKNIYELMEKLKDENPNINYLLIIEGNTQRSMKNHLLRPTDGYRLSYNRALSLMYYWQTNGFDFKRLENCELLIVGSGYFSKSRELNEVENRKFTIQITPKIGEFITN
ncbi:hypothetical protein OBK16_12035 [Empedobacter falsenii]|uniref:hypothetical protein n=1 Tax=Empedobacter falsenii TaxID=343874 RepID=UPI00056EF865|nr:hypothetical protein [Empedobacter falsenii]